MFIQTSSLREIIFEENKLNTVKVKTLCFKVDRCTIVLFIVIRQSYVTRKYMQTFIDVNNRLDYNFKSLDFV